MFFKYMDLGCEKRRKAKCLSLKTAFYMPLNFSKYLMHSFFSSSAKIYIEVSEG